MFKVFLIAIFGLGSIDGFCEEEIESQNTTQEIFGYSLSARKPKDDDWNMFFGAAFLYWRASQDGLMIGRSVPLHRATTAPTLNEEALYQDFSYKPGFKVYVGFGSADADDWVVYGEWTELHQTTHTSYQFTDRNIVPQTWMARINTLYLATGVDSSWRMHLDLLDIGWSRPMYLGKKLISTPLLGLRTGWINQRFNLTYSFSNGSPMEAAFDSKSWGVGPLVGVMTDWELGSGFSIVGKFAGSLLYTSYTTLNLYENITLQTLAASEVNATYGTYRTVRPNADLGIGVAWKYTFSEKYILDFAARYDLSLFWNQNVLRGIADNYDYATSEGASGSLGLSGLTVSAGFNF